MNWKTTILIIALLLTITCASALEKTVYKLDYDILERGDDGQQSFTLTLSASEYPSKTVTFYWEDSEDGDTLEEWSEIYPGSFTLTKTNNTNTTKLSETITVLLAIPEDASSGSYNAYLKWGETINDRVKVKVEIPKECDIEVRSNYARAIQQGTTTFKDTIYVGANQYCTATIDMGRPVLKGDTIQTTSGTKPLSVPSGELSDIDSGEETSFDVTFNVDSLIARTYTPNVEITGTYRGRTLKKTINFEIQVFGGSDPLTAGEKPYFEVPNNAATNERFNIYAKRVNANFQPTILPNQLLDVLNLTIDGNTWVWNCKINQSGTTTLQTATLYKGSQLGKVLEYDIQVSGSGGTASTGEMKMEYFPSVTQLSPGETLSMLVRDKGNNNIVSDAKIYYKASLVTDNKVTVADGAMCFSATHPSYQTLDTCINVSRPSMNLAVIPEKPEYGETATIYAKDPLNAENIGNVTFTIDDVKVSQTFIVSQTVGEHTLKAVHPKYKTTEKKITVEQAASVTVAPEDLKKGEVNTLSLSKPTDWRIDYTNNDGETFSVASGEQSSTVTFNPEKNGVYHVYLKQTMARQYEVKGFEMPKWLTYVLIGIGAVVVLLLIFSAFGGKKKARVSYAPMKSEDFSGGLTQQF